MRRFVLAPLARIRAAEARRSSREACRARQEAEGAREQAASLEARAAAPELAAGEDATAVGSTGVFARVVLPRPAFGLAEGARIRARLQRARRLLLAGAAEARGVAEVLADVSAQAVHDALLARRRAGALERAEARWDGARRREREAREEREAEEAWAARPRSGS